MRTGFSKIETILVPIGVGDTGKTAVTLAKAMAKEIVLIGVVRIEEGEAVSGGAIQAKQVRKRLMSFRNSSIRYKSRVIVSETPWKDLQDVIVAEKPDLFMIESKENGLASFEIPIHDIFSTAHCNVVLIKGSPHPRFDRTLLALRGGPHAELSLSVGISLKPTHLDVLHLSLSGMQEEAAFKGLKKILSQMPEVTLRSVVTDDSVKTIFEEAKNYDLVILGASSGNNASSPPIGPVAEKLLRESEATILVVKTPYNISDYVFDESAGSQAISILVDKWFAENTFGSDEFSNLKQMMQLKEKQGITISLALPALNEEETVGRVISTVKKVLVDEVPLLDEIILIDSNSNDHTREIAADLGVPVYIHQELLPELGAREGKGEALWKSLLVTRGDIIAWIDTDIVNIHPRFVYGIIGPLLLNPEIQYVKGFYRRPLKVGNKIQAGGGGRVTELTARPMLNLFYPELSGIIQPLSGEYAGRRSAVEQVGFSSGYGVETGMLIDIFEGYGLRAIAQVDLLERVHHNQELEALSKMSFAIIQTILHKLESRYERAIIEDVNKSMKLIRYADGGYYLDVEKIAELERPPMVQIPVYLERHPR